jgi:hypothetical protein
MDQGSGRPGTDPGEWMAQAPDCDPGMPSREQQRDSTGTGRGGARTARSQPALQRTGDAVPQPAGPSGRTALRPRRRSLRWPSAPRPRRRGGPQQPARRFGSCRVPARAAERQSSPAAAAQVRCGYREPTCRRGQVQRLDTHEGSRVR